MVIKKVLTKEVMEMVSKDPGKRSKMFLDLVYAQLTKEPLSISGWADKWGVHRKSVYRFLGRIRKTDPKAYSEIVDAILLPEKSNSNASVVTPSVTPSVTPKSQQKQALRRESVTLSVTYSDTPEGALLKWVERGNKNDKGEFIHDGAWKVQSMAEPLNEAKCKWLLDNYPKIVIFEVLEAMHNNFETHIKAKGRTNAKLTFVQWAKVRDRNKSNSPDSRPKAKQSGQIYN